MLSILIPVYNYNIVPLINELQHQAEKEKIAYEIIAIDDCSDEMFNENFISGNLKNCKISSNPVNLGRTQTRKILAEKAAYDMLLFLDADVMPANTDFIKNYIPYIETNSPVVFGGIAYLPENTDPNVSLRHEYGKNREEKPAGERMKNPYGIFSGNLLIRKDVFMQNNFDGTGNLYGLDNYFCYKLFVNKIPVVHINNPVYHLGLEENTVFFRKALQSVEMRKKMLHDLNGIENINPLLKHYKMLKKYHLTGIVSLGFKIAEPILKKMVLNKKPNLMCLDIYRLGYICSLK